MGSCLPTVNQQHEFNSKPNQQTEQVFLPTLQQTNHQNTDPQAKSTLELKINKFDNEGTDSIYKKTHYQISLAKSGNYPKENIIQKINNFQIDNQIINNLIKNIGQYQYNLKYDELEIFQKEENLDTFAIFTFVNGDVIESDWVQGLPLGRCRWIYQDGSFYQGYCDKFMKNIHGRLINSDGSYYEGEWLDDKKHGKGQFSFQDGAKYNGEWIDDLQEGYGEEYWPDGSCYKGQYKQGEKQGKGRFEWTDSSFYEGEFVSNNLEGYGEYRWADGRSYIGYWKKNKLEGKGTFRWPDGRQYSGEYNEDKKQGQGTMEWPDGKKYIGNWNNGKQHGEGKLIENGISYNGEWENGVKVIKNDNIK